MIMHCKSLVSANIMPVVLFSFLKLCIYAEFYFDSIQIMVVLIYIYAYATSIWQICLDLLIVLYNSLKSQHKSDCLSKLEFPFDPMIIEAE